MTIKESYLYHFTGSEQYHLYNKLILLTDGAKFLFEKWECFWFLDIIWSLQFNPIFSTDPYLEFIQFWTLEVNPDKSATVFCERDTDDLVYTQDIEFTDFPFTVKVYVQKMENQFVVMLPSEY